MRYIRCWEVKEFDCCEGCHHEFDFGSKEKKPYEQVIEQDLSIIGCCLFWGWVQQKIAKGELDELVGASARETSRAY